MGCSSSIVKHTRINQNVEDRECGHQKPQSSVSSSLAHGKIEQENIKCKTHNRQDVSYVCESTYELACRKCVQNNQGMKHTIENKKCYVDIFAYTDSLGFKRLDTRTSEQLRERKSFLDGEMKQIEYNEKRALSKGDEMLDKIKIFVDRLVELIRHMEKDLCSKVNSKIDDYMTSLKHRRDFIQTWQDELLTIEESIGRHKLNSKSTAMYLKSVFDCKEFVSSVKSNVQPMKESTDYKLTMNKQLTLEDIVGRKHSMGNISLGEIEIVNGDSPMDHLLSTINENEISDEISLNQEPPKTSKRPTTVNSKIRRGKFDKDAWLVPRSKSPVNSSTKTRLSLHRASNNSMISQMSIATPSIITVSPVKSDHGKNVFKSKTIQISYYGDVPNFTDSLVLDDGKIVLCDQKNEKLILLSKSLILLDELQLESQPHNISKTTTDNKTIAVTLPEKNMIQFVWVLDQKLEDPEKSLICKTKCRGITYIDNHLLYTSRNDVIVLKEDNKSKPWMYEYAFRFPVSLHADKQSNSVFVSCKGLKNTPGEVVKIDFDTVEVEQVMRFSDIKQPVCCSQDSNQNLYICDIDPPCIHLVSSGGHYCRQVLDSNEGKLQHINFFPESDEFLITENDSDNVHIYELRQIY